MQLASLVNSTLPQRADEIAGALRAWSKGQILDASVVRTGNGQALLQVNGQQVLAQTRMPLIVGQALRLQVDKAGTQPQLRVVDGPGNGSVADKAAYRGALLQTINPGVAQAKPALPSGMQNAGGANMSNEALAAALLRSALPHRQPMSQSMRALEQFVATPRPTPAHPGLEQARAMASDLLQGLPRPEDAGDANRLRAMVQRSGLFHEAEMAQHSKVAQQAGGDADAALTRHSVLNPPAADMKARLMAVAESLASAIRGGAETDQSSAQAAAALRGAVSNIEANQVASVRGSEHNAVQNNNHGAVWRVDLPFADARGHQALQLRVDREPRGSTDGSSLPSWIAQVTIQPPGHAPLQARIALNGDTVYTTFITAEGGLSRQIEQGEEELRQLLSAVHLDLGGMSCQQAQVEEEHEGLSGTALVSTHA